MTQFVIADNVNTQLATAALSTATTLTLASSTNLPTLTTGQVMPLTLNDAATGGIYEVVYVTAISGVTLTVERAQEGTGALNWSLGDWAYCAPTAGTVATAFGNPNNVFQVAPAIASEDAVNLGQVLAPSRLAFFATSGTWTCPAGVTQVVSSGAAGGGGGGGSNGTTNGGEGGGGGQCAFKQLLTVVPGTVYTVTVGAAGIGGAASANGTSGGATSFGALLTLTGGGGGSHTGSTLGGGGGFGGANGQDVSASAVGGTGGGTMFGPANNGRVATGPTSTGYGAGGVGGSSLTGGGAGSNAAPGFLMIEW